MKNISESIRDFLSNINCNINENIVYYIDFSPSTRTIYREMSVLREILKAHKEMNYD